MKPICSLSLPALLAAVAASNAPVGAQPPQVPILECFPSKIQARIEARDRALRERAPRTIDGHTLRFVIEDVTRWGAGDTVRVGFRGGNAELHRKIADAAAEWAQHGNLILDFGGQGGGELRTWTTGDADFGCEIRVAFDDQGYWSLVGRDSIDRQIIAPNQTSLNLEGFDTSLPPDWQTVVLHEFGHALGFHHEHQNPLGGCDDEFDWDSIYTFLAGPPNFWPRHVVDHNLRSLPDTDAYWRSAHDPLSIMHYSFPAWMFRRGAESPCCTTRNAALSASDQQGMLTAYPRAAPEVEQRVDQQRSFRRSLRDSGRLNPGQAEMFKD